jgi:hypothetical protein
LANLIVALSCLLMGSACVHAGGVRKYVIPPRCIRIEVQSFTQPCTPRPDGKLLCNGVVISAYCLEARPPKP